MASCRVIAPLLLLTACSLGLGSSIVYYTMKLCTWETYRYYNYDKNEYECKEADTDEQRDENIKFNILKLVIGIFVVLFVSGLFLFCALFACLRSRGDNDNYTRMGPSITSDKSPIFTHKRNLPKTIYDLEKPPKDPAFQVD